MSENFFEDNGVAESGTMEERTEAKTAAELQEEEDTLITLRKKINSASLGVLRYTLKFIKNIPIYLWRVLRSIGRFLYEYMPCVCKWVFNVFLLVCALAFFIALLFWPFLLNLLKTVNETQETIWIFVGLAWLLGIAIPGAYYGFKHNLGKKLKMYWQRRRTRKKTAQNQPPDGDSIQPQFADVEIAKKESSQNT